MRTVCSVLWRTGQRANGGVTATKEERKGKEASTSRRSSKRRLEEEQEQRKENNKKGGGEWCQDPRYRQIRRKKDRTNGCPKQAGAVHVGFRNIPSQQQHARRRETMHRVVGHVTTMLLHVRPP